VDPAALGFYTIALNLVLIIDGIGTRIIGGIAFPALSEMARSEPARVSPTLYRLRWPLDTLLLLASGFLFVMGPTLVHLVYDQRYESVGPLLQILALSLAVMRFNVFSVVYMALGRPEWQAFVNVAKVVSLSCVLPPLFAIYGLSGAVYGIALHGLIVLPLQYYFNERCKINNLTFELIVLVFWVAGFALGHLTLAASHLVGL
jgi:O-antigen/teichoic acid export membrane protein